MGEVERDHNGSPGSPAGLSWSTLHRIVSRWFWNISGEGDSSASLGDLFHVWTLPSREVLPHAEVELPVHQFLPIASGPVACVTGEIAFSKF